LREGGPAVYDLPTANYRDLPEFAHDPLALAGPEENIIVDADGGTRRAVDNGLVRDFAVPYNARERKYYCRRIGYIPIDK